MGRRISTLSDQNKWISASLQKPYKLTEYPPHPTIQFDPLDTGRKLNVHKIVQFTSCVQGEVMNWHWTNFQIKVVLTYLWINISFNTCPIIFSFRFIQSHSNPSPSCKRSHSNKFNCAYIKTINFCKKSSPNFASNIKWI